MATVLTFGTFDVIHRGHIHMLQKAKEYGDHLVVILGRDETVHKVKGKKPFHTEVERKEMLEALSVVDEVLLGHENDPYYLIGKVRPDIIALGYDQEVFVDNLEKKITEFGLSTKIVRLPPYKGDHLHSSKLKKAMGMHDAITDEPIQV